MNKLVSEYLRKQNQINFERKTSQNRFLLILSETQSQKLEKICQKISIWRQLPSRPLATRHISKQFLYNRIVIFNSTEPFFWTSVNTHAFLALRDYAKNWLYCPFNITLTAALHQRTLERLRLAFTANGKRQK